MTATVDPTTGGFVFPDPGDPVVCTCTAETLTDPFDAAIAAVVCLGDLPVDHPAHCTVCGALALGVPCPNDLW